MLQSKQIVIDPMSGGKERVLWVTLFSASRGLDARSRGLNARFPQRTERKFSGVRVNAIKNESKTWLCLSFGQTRLISADSQLQVIVLDGSDNGGVVTERNETRRPLWSFRWVHHFYLVIMANPPQHYVLGCTSFDRLCKYFDIFKPFALG